MTEIYFINLSAPVRCDHVLTTFEFVISQCIGCWQTGERKLHLEGEHTNPGRFNDRTWNDRRLGTTNLFLSRYNWKSVFFSLEYERPRGRECAAEKKAWEFRHRKGKGYSLLMKREMPSSFNTFFLLFIDRQPTSNCLQRMVCSCVLPSNFVFYK